VRNLAEQIESETFDGHLYGKPLRVFFDEWDIDVGQNLILKINISWNKNARKGQLQVAVGFSPSHSLGR
jgi:hypothetical protein